MIRVLLLLVSIGGGLAWAYGPRVPVDTAVRFDPAAIGSDVAAYVRESEAGVEGLTAETAKEIVWADPAVREPTPLAIVYIHGYSADKRELRPLPDAIARDLGANLFLTRLAGHGLDLDALDGPTANDWLNDYAEALAIGRRIGERVVVLASSTGGTLAVWGASLGLSDDVAGLAMISPNFAIADRRAPLLTLPFAETLIPLVYPTRQLTLAEPAPDGSRTADFPTVALLPMAALVQRVRAIDPGTIATPALFVYSPLDRVVDPAATLSAAERWGGPHEIVRVDSTEDPLGHLLAGDLFSPSGTAPLAQTITRWIEALPDRDTDAQTTR